MLLDFNLTRCEVAVWLLAPLAWKMDSNNPADPLRSDS